MGIGLFSGNKR